MIDSMEKVNCYICDSSDFELVYENIPDRFVAGNTYHMIRCNKCGFSFLSPRPTEAASSQFYDLVSYQPHNLSEQSLFDCIYDRVRKTNSRNKRRMIEKLVPIGSLLDIGCGTGEFLLEMRTGGWDLCGMETAPEARKQANDQSLMVMKSLEEVNGSFDVITLWHVLEHIHKIKDLFNHLNRLLKPGGYLVLAVPNIDSIDAKYYKHNWVALDAPRHLYHFRPKDIHKLLDKWKMKILRISSILYFDPWYNAILSAQLKAKETAGSSLFSMLEAFLMGKLSFLNGIFNSSKCASPVYIVQRNE